jgi:hypothetical protein
MLYNSMFVTVCNFNATEFFVLEPKGHGGGGGERSLGLFYGLILSETNGLSYLQGQSSVQATSKSSVDILFSTKLWMKAQTPSSKHKWTGLMRYCNNTY